MNTYARKPDAKRAGKKAHGEGKFTIYQLEDGRWTYEAAVKGCGERIRELVLDQMEDGAEWIDDEAILAIVRDEFPHLRTQKSDVAWNKTRLRKAGHAVPKNVGRKQKEEANAG